MAARIVPATLAEGNQFYARAIAEGDGDTIKFDTTIVGVVGNCFANTYRLCCLFISQQYTGIRSCINKKVYFFTKGEPHQHRYIEILKVVALHGVCRRGI